jgi:hypothetical protein
MEELTSALLARLDFFTSGLGVLSLGTLAALILLLWDWRLALASLLVIQVGVAALAVRIEGLPVAWAGVQLGVITLCVLLLGLSAYQVPTRQILRPPGGWLLRLLVLVLLLVSWRAFDLNVTVPLLAPAVGRLFVWLALCALLLLSLGDSPLYTGLALLLWCIPVQAIVEVFVPGHNLFVLIGMAEIALALTCSYLLLVAAAPVPQPAVVLTDIAFPAPSTHPPLPAPRERPRLPGERGELPTGRTALPSESISDVPFAARGSQ